jgi:hypothetical protein
LLVVQIDFNQLFRGFSVRDMDDAVWNLATFPKNRSSNLDWTTSRKLGYAISLGRC